MKSALLLASSLLAPAVAFVAPSSASITASSRSPSAPLRAVGAWYEEDIVVTLVPKFKIKEGMRDKYIELLPKFIDLVKANEAETCVHYGFVGPTEDDFVICREGYVSAEGVLAHLDNVGDVLGQALEGPAAELEKLKEPLADFGPAYYPLAEGSLRNKRGW